MFKNNPNSIDNKIDTTIDESLLDVIKTWIQSEEFVSISKLQRTFSISFPRANSIINELISLKLIEHSQTDNKGYRVVNLITNSHLKIYLIDINKNIINELTKEFIEHDDVEVIYDDFAHFMDTHKDVECIVSPANSFSDMSGGYDKAITDYFGNTLQENIQDYINTNFYGEQPIGTSFIINIPLTNKKLIHTPTMRKPSLIKDPFIIYQCMRTSLMVAINSKVKSILIPSFGGATGKVSPKIVAHYTKLGYDQIFFYLNNKR